MLKVTHQIEALVSTYGSHSGLSHSYVCLLSAKESMLLKRLAGGAGVTTRKLDRIFQWFSDNWPLDLPWPDDIPRPDPSPASPAVLALIERQEARGNLNNSPVHSEIDPLALNARGELANPVAITPQVSGGMDNPAYRTAVRDSVYQVVRDYADAGPRAGRWPRAGSRAHKILDLMVEAGDVRFAQRAALIRRLETPS